MSSGTPISRAPGAPWGGARGGAVAPAGNAVLAASTVTTPVGALTLLEAGGCLVAAGFAPAAVLAHRLVRRGEQEPRVVPGSPGTAMAALVRYLDGDLEALDGLAVAPQTSSFRQAVQTALREIPPGATISYTELAHRTGNPLAARAVAAACAANPVAVVVPCHRVIARSGSLHGYRYGLAVKAWLLAHEQAVTDRGRRVREVGEVGEVSQGGQVRRAEPSVAAGRG